MGLFCLPQLQSKEGEQLVLRSAWGLSSPGNEVGRSSTPCRKRSQVWGRETVAKIYAAETPVGSGKNFEKQAQSSIGLEQLGKITSRLIAHLFTQLVD